MTSESRLSLEQVIGLATMDLDIGPPTVARFREALRDAGTIVWNGLMGMCRMPAFAVGTTEMAKTIAECSAFTVAGGGDTVAAIAEAGVAEKFGYLSMAGAAFLEYLEGRELPGVAALAEARPVTSGAGPR
jgi:phosphoglycerate kinase